MTRKERQALAAEQRKRQEERKEAQVRFKPSPIPQEVREKARERDQKVMLHQKVNGIRPLGAPKQLGPVSGLANLIMEGKDQANAGDVHGHNEREREELPAYNVRPQTPGNPQVRAARPVLARPGVRRRVRSRWSASSARDS
ncbi:hypothetical protein ACR6C2_17035 [Streptomyces sp. INA 01156]